MVGGRSWFFLFALVAGLGQARADQIDFDDVPIGMTAMTFVSGNPVPASSVLTNQYAPLGVVFANTALVDLGLGNAADGGVNGIGGISPWDTLTYSSQDGGPQISFSFWNGTTPAVTNFVSIQGDLIGNSYQSQTLSAYDLAGNLVGSTTVYDSGGQTYAISAPNIHNVEWSGVDINDNQVGGVGLNHLVFNTLVSVPEPSTFLLAATASLIGVACARKRRGS